MRLDKYLKVSRLIKRRSVANEACGAGRVSLNGKPGDILELGFGEKRIRVEVLSTQEHAARADAPAMYKQLE